jgi:hypothetical protein
MSEAKFHLTPLLFSEKEKPLAQHGGLSASAFRFDSDVCGLRLKNEQGELVLLPYQGQQIWSAAFGGRDLTMKSMFTEPRPTLTYLETYGSFLLHCGATAMGVPTGEDSHPLHGELPNAPYQEAFLLAGKDAGGEYLALGGQYQYTVAFNHNYLAQPLVKLYEGSSLFRVQMTIQNLKHSEMELMYLAHVNFRPVDNGRLVYSAQPGPEHVRVRRSIPAHIHPKPGYVEFIEELGRSPEKHELLKPDLVFDPEVVFFIDYLADTRLGPSMQVHPDGSGDYIRHRPEQLDHGVRWISRTADQDALGIVLPGTAEPEGYHAEKAKGNIKTIPAEGSFHLEMELGYLPPEEVSQVEERINKIVG